MTQYEINLPRVDNSKPWITIRSFDTRNEAVEFCNQTWDLEDGMFCIISQTGNDFIVDTPNPCVNSTNNQFLEIEGFTHKEDAISFCQEAYGADRNGYVNLISEVT